MNKLFLSLNKLSEAKKQWDAHMVRGDKADQEIWNKVGTPLENRQRFGDPMRTFLEAQYEVLIALIEEPKS